jgi:hypothetical protein
MHTITVKLKQHTPLIHFQHDQEGATLRASEVKPKLDKFILSKLSPEERQKGETEGWIKKKNDKEWLDYKMRIVDNPDNIISIDTNEKRFYTNNDEEKDKKKGKTIKRVRYGEIVQNNNDKNVRYVIVEQDNKKYFAKLRKSDSKVIYDLNGYPCFFANMDTDIMNPNEYKRVTFAQDPFGLIILTKYTCLYGILLDKDRLIISNFFLTHNFGTRQSKGFGSFYPVKEDNLYLAPNSSYHFSLPVSEEYYDVFKRLFKTIELFSKTLRGGINEKRGSKTIFYFKSLAFMYCKDVLSSEWDKKKVKTKFYFDYSDRRKDSLSKQRREYPNDDDYDILFFDASEGYDIRDLMGFSTNEEWQSYKDSIEKKVAIKKDDKIVFPRKDDVLPVDRMRSPLLFKPICQVDEDDNVEYIIHLIFQDEMVGTSDFKRQEEICFFSKREKDERGLPKRFRLKIPRNFSMNEYFDYIINRLQFDISSHVEEKYQQHEYYELLDDIYSQLKR